MLNSTRTALCRSWSCCAKCNWLARQKRRHWRRRPAEFPRKSCASTLSVARSALCVFCPSACGDLTPHRAFSPASAKSTTRAPQGAKWEGAASLDAHAARLLSAFVLVQVDVKSPVDYLKNWRWSREDAALCKTLLRRNPQAARRHPKRLQQGTRMKTAIKKITGRRIWDSRGRPTVEVDVELADGARIVGDDFLVTNAARVSAAAVKGQCNAVLLKPNQAGTVRKPGKRWGTRRSSAGA
jgi:hypothetical protein